MAPLGPEPEFVAWKGGGASLTGELPMPGRGPKVSAGARFRQPLLLTARVYSIMAAYNQKKDSRLLFNTW